MRNWLWKWAVKHLSPKVEDPSLHWALIHECRRLQKNSDVTVMRGALGIPAQLERRLVMELIRLA